MRGMTAVAGVVLAGGRSRRMGTSKAWLEWHGSTLLRRVTGIVARAVDGPVIVVRGPGQPLPPLAPGVQVRDDPTAGLGPLQGLAVGLAAAAPAAAAFVCSTDMPLLHPALVRRVVRALDAGADVALPVARGRLQPLAAAYRPALAATITRWLARGDRRLTLVVERSTARILQPADLLADPVLAAVDPGLMSLHSLNRHDEYVAARARPAPLVTVVCGTAAPASGGRCRVRAATVAGAAAGAGVALDRARVRLDGVPADDGETPLVDGDVVVVTGTAGSGREGRQGPARRAEHGDGEGVA